MALGVGGEASRPLEVLHAIEDLQALLEAAGQGTSSTVMPAAASRRAPSSRQIRVASSASFQWWVRQSPRRGRPANGSKGAGSAPSSTSRKKARSSTERAMHPRVSRLSAKCRTPAKLSSPNVGL